MRRIECYKLLTVDDFGRVLTPYSKYPMTFDKTLRDKVKIKKWDKTDMGFMVDRGMFHCFMSLSEAERMAKTHYGFLVVATGRVPEESFIIARTTVPMFTRYYRGKYADAESLCAKRIRLSPKNIVALELSKVPEE